MHVYICICALWGWVSVYVCSSGCACVYLWVCVFCFSFTSSSVGENEGADIKFHFLGEGIWLYRRRKGSEIKPIVIPQVTLASIAIYLPHPPRTKKGKEKIWVYQILSQEFRLENKLPVEYLVLKLQFNETMSSYQDHEVKTHEYKWVTQTAHFTRRTHETQTKKWNHHQKEKGVSRILGASQPWCLPLFHRNLTAWEQIACV